MFEENTVCTYRSLSSYSQVYTVLCVHMYVYSIRYMFASSDDYTTYLYHMYIEFDDSESIQGDLATLSSEINIKQKLIDQLEFAQKSMQSMKKQYEDKLVTLAQQIQRTETERDKVLKDLGKYMCVHVLFAYVLYVRTYI